MENYKFQDILDLKRKCSTWSKIIKELKEIKSKKYK